MFSHTDKKDTRIWRDFKTGVGGLGGLVYTCTTVCCCPLHVSTLAVWLLFVFKSAPFAVLPSITSLSNGKTS